MDIRHGKHEMWHSKWGVVRLKLTLTHCTCTRYRWLPLLHWNVVKIKAYPSVLTSVTIRRPRKKLPTEIARRRSLRRQLSRKKSGYMSAMVVTNASWYTNYRDKRFVFNWKKNCIWFVSVITRVQTTLIHSRTSLSNPKKMIIMKKKMAQSWGSGIRATARG